MNPDSSITIRQARPTAQAHVDAVRAALQDGRLDRAAFTARAGLTAKIVQHWMHGDPLEDTFDMRVWGAAVTTTPADVMLPTGVPHGNA